MRLLVIFITLASLLLLPFSGNGFSMPELGGKVTENQTTQRVDASQNAHCDQMAARLAEIRLEQTQAEASERHDCCDDPMTCFIDCSADCGHCVMSGYGSSAATSLLNVQCASGKSQRVFSENSRYSLLLAKVNPPPIIS